MGKVAKMLHQHRALLLHWFRAGRALSSGAVEGFNNKSKVTLRKAYGYRSYKAMELALYHGFGNLPEPNFDVSVRMGRAGQNALPSETGRMVGVGGAFARRNGSEPVRQFCCES